MQIINIYQKKIEEPLMRVLRGLYIYIYIYITLSQLNLLYNYILNVYFFSKYLFKKLYLRVTIPLKMRSVVTCMY